MDPTTMNQIIQLIVGLVAGYAGKHYLDRWTEVKKYVHETRKVFDAIDNALYDDKIDEQTFREKYESNKSNIVK